MENNNKALNYGGHKINDNSIISNNTNNNKGLQILADEFCEQKIFVNYDSKKIPFIPCSYKAADYTNSNNWGTLKQAIASIDKYNRKGIGIILTDTLKGHLCGLDIDKSIDENGNICKEAQEIIKALNSYTEISISGKGIHILFYANKNGKACKNSKLDWCEHLELYDKKYFTVSGKVINDIGIMERQKECDAIYNKYFKPLENSTTDFSIKYDETIFTEEQISGYIKDIEKILNNERNTIFKDNWNGKRSKRHIGGSPDDSRNDFDLLKGLAFFYPHKINLIEQLALRSPYCKGMNPERFQEKWLRRRNDYLIPTIIKAIKDVEPKLKGGVNNGQLFTYIQAIMDINKI